MKNRIRKKNVKRIRKNPYHQKFIRAIFYQMIDDYLKNLKPKEPTGSIQP